MSGPAGALGKPGAGGEELALWNRERLQQQRGGSAPKADGQHHLHLFYSPLTATRASWPAAKVSLKTGGACNVSEHLHPR